MNETYFVANVRERDWSRVLNLALAALLAGVLAFSSAQTLRLNEANARYIIGCIHELSSSGKFRVVRP